MGEWLDSPILAGLAIAVAAAGGAIWWAQRARLTYLKTREVERALEPDSPLVLPTPNEVARASRTSGLVRASQWLIGGGGHLNQKLMR